MSVELEFLDRTTLFTDGTQEGVRPDQLHEQFYGRRGRKLLRLRDVEKPPDAFETPPLQALHLFLAQYFRQSLRRFSAGERQIHLRVGGARFRGISAVFHNERTQGDIQEKVKTELFARFDDCIDG